MAYLRFTLWISLLFYDLRFLGAENAHGQRLPAAQTLENVQLLKELQFEDENFQLDSAEKLIVKRNTDAPPSPQVFKFELDDAKEPDEETKKFIQIRARELQLKMKDVEVVNITQSKRSKRAATQKIKPQFIPFLISDAKEPDDATKELIRRSRAKEISLTTKKEPSRHQSRHKDTYEAIQKREPSARQSRGKTFDSITSNKEPLKQGRVKSVTVTTESKEPLRQGKVQSVPLTSATYNDSLRENRANVGTSTSQNTKRSNKKSPRKRTRRFAQLTEPRYIKFELHDVKEPSSGDTRADEVHILPRPIYGAKILNQTPDPNTSQYDSDSSGQGSKYRYFLQAAPRKPQFGPSPYPKRYEPNDLVFRVSKMQKYIASGQGLENINTNIEITIPPAVTATAILSGYPSKQIYGQRICAYGSPGGCQMGPLAPSVAEPPPPPQQEFRNPAQNLVAENEVLPAEQHQQRYYYHFYPQPQPEVNQQFIPIAKPYQTVAQIVHAPVVEQQPPSHQEPQIAQNLIDDGKLVEPNPLLKIAYIQPTYGHKLYPYAFGKNIQVKPSAIDQSAVGSFNGVNNQEVPQSKNTDQASQINLLKNNQEFQELSALIGKSPMDQVHGLSYLLAKEMQRQKGSSTNNPQRPQDQTSPILFHPRENKSITGSSHLVQKQNFEDPKVENNQVLPFQPLRPLIHKNSPITTSSVQQDLRNQANSEVSASNAKAIGLSPNYNGIDSHNNDNNNYSPPKIYSETENDSTMEYASKYAFGYRVRDFESGNDFAHKQNRDQDGVTRGQYHILMPDGRIQNVIYYADDTGFHADILY